MNFETLLEQTADELGIPSLAPGEDGVAALVVDDAVTVLFEKSPFDPDAIVFYSVVGAMPAGGREAFMERLLEAQLFGGELGSGISFGLSRESGEILLNRSFSLLTGSPDRLAEDLEVFVNWVQHWTKQLAENGTTAAENISGHFVRI